MTPRPRKPTKKLRVVLDVRFRFLGWRKLPLQQRRLVRVRLWSKAVDLANEYGLFVVDVAKHSKRRGVR